MAPGHLAAPADYACLADMSVAAVSVRRLSGSARGLLSERRLHPAMGVNRGCAGALAPGASETSRQTVCREIWAAWLHDLKVHSFRSPAAPVLAEDCRLSHAGTVDLLLTVLEVGAH